MAKLDAVLAKVDSARERLDRLPGILQRFRQSVLAQAVSGKLTEGWRKENAGVESAEGLLVKMKGKRKNLEKLKLIKKEKDLPEIQAEELLFEKPQEWTWCRLGEFGQLINGDRGKNYPNRNEYVPDGIPFLNTGHIEPDGSVSLETMNYLTRKKFDSLNSGKIQKHDLIYCLRGATLGKTAVIDMFNEGAVASSLVIIRPLEGVESWYLYYFLTSEYGKELIRRFDNGSAQPNLSANSVGLYVFPLPPLAEQKEIVRRVQALFAVADRIEARYEVLKEKVEGLPQALLAKAFRGELVGREA